MKSFLATISIGSADGVEPGDRFHVVRGEMYICDILITDVEPDLSAGILELIRDNHPKIGDIVTTW